MDKELFKAGVNHYLGVSTGHITKRDSELLTDIANGGLDDVMLTAWGFDYGWWVYVNPEVKDDPTGYKKHLTDAGFSEAFFDLLTVADSLECSYINLDCDGLTYEGVPQFEW